MPLIRVNALYKLAIDIENAKIDKDKEDAEAKKQKERKSRIDALNKPTSGYHTLGTLQDRRRIVKDINDGKYDGQAAPSIGGFDELADELDDM